MWKWLKSVDSSLRAKPGNDQVVAEFCLHFVLFFLNLKVVKNNLRESG